VTLSKEQIQGLDVALNEATLLGIETRTEKQLVGATFRVLTLPESGPSPQDSRVKFLFNGVGRIAASYRHGRWNDRTAKLEIFSVEQLLQIAQSFCCAIYGWEFFNLEDKEFDWLDRLSLDWRGNANGLSNSFTFSQDGGNRHLDCCVWFDAITIHTPEGTVISLEEFIAGGKRWWDALYAGDPRANGFGIFPMK
jgi:hypothetical protein